jgi:hypothetical protein
LVACFICSSSFVFACACFWACSQGLTYLSQIWESLYNLEHNKATFYPPIIW